VTPRKTGRPPIDPADPSPSAKVQLRLPARLYDKSYAAARRQRLSVPDWIRLTLHRATLPPPKGQP